MQYAIKGSDEQWSKLLDGKDVNEAGTLQIRTVREKRKALGDDEFTKEANTEKQLKKTKTSKKKRKSKGQR